MTSGTLAMPLRSADTGCVLPRDRTVISFAVAAKPSKPAGHGVAALRRIVNADRSVAVQDGKLVEPPIGGDAFEFLAGHRGPFAEELSRRLVPEPDGQRSHEDHVGAVQRDLMHGRPG